MGTSFIVDNVRSRVLVRWADKLLNTDWLSLYEILACKDFELVRVFFSISLERKDSHTFNAFCRIIVLMSQTCSSMLSCSIDFSWVCRWRGIFINDPDPMAMKFELALSSSPIEIDLVLDCVITCTGWPLFCRLCQRLWNFAPVRLCNDPRLSPFNFSSDLAWNSKFCILPNFCEAQ